MLDTCLYVSAAGFYILLLSFISTEFSQTALASYNISSGKFKWLDAGEECLPATPDITAATHSPTVYTVGDLGIDIQENEKIWVGYYQAWRVFEYIGCVSQSYYSSIQPDYVEIKGDPGQCFPKCTDSSIVGVTKTRCYCLGHTWDAKLNVATMLTECTQKCDHPRVACGFDTNAMYSYWSIYKINSNVDHSTIIDWLSKTSGDKNCLCIDPTHPKKYYWRTCTEALLVMCNDGNDIKEKNMTYKTWIDAANLCFGQNYVPTDKSSSAWVKKGAGSPLWTGCFKTLVTFKHDANISVNRRHDKKWYGYLYKDEQNQLRLGFMDNTTEKRVLCGNGKSDRAKKLTKKAASSTTTASSQSNSSTGSEISTTSPQSSTSTIGTSTSGIYIALGASAAGVVFIATITVLTIVFLKRRRKVKNRSIDDTGTNQGNENDDTAKTSNNYFILKPHEKEGEHENVTYDTADDNATYDTTEDGQEYERVKTENVYNQLGIGTEQTYDLTITHKTNTSVKANKVSLDDTYDFASAENKAKANVHTDNIYDKTENMDDNVYNQLGDKCIQNVTDNVYGIQGQND